VYYNDMLELQYVKVRKEDLTGHLPMLRVEGQVVKEGFIPDLRTILEYARSAEKAGQA
jgi:hypothetical protein